MKIKNIDFPNSLLTALHDQRVVIFAGAGVSRGAPASLPDFAGLVESVARGTFQDIDEKESNDRFLGRLKQRGMSVHERAARILTRENSKPNLLHCDLLRLFSDASQVRIVTTNFDCLFEGASKGTFLDSSFETKVFISPALPSGQGFRGIVHIHGVVTYPSSMVLTDEDFGIAYLTEGGTRRFLYGMFRENPVLFVGYSHKDIVFNYLSRALQSDGPERWALSSCQVEEIRWWEGLGIEPIVYSKTDKNDFQALYQGVSSLADRVRQSLTEWRREVEEVANAGPTGIEDLDRFIDYAFQDSNRVRFFTEVAKSSEWVNWLESRGLLDGMSNSESLTERENLLLFWMVEQFMYSNSKILFSLIHSHNMCLPMNTWQRLVQSLESETTECPLDTTILSQWITLLIHTAPNSSAPWHLQSMGETCDKHGLVGCLAQVCEALMSRLIRPRIEVQGEGSNELQYNDLYLLEEFRKKHIVSNLPVLAVLLIEMVNRYFEERNRLLREWQKPDDGDAERNCIRCSDKHREEFDTHLDAPIRTALESLAWMFQNQTAKGITWHKQLVSSNSRILRRIGISAIEDREDLLPDEKVDWILKLENMEDPAEKGEILNAICNAYPSLDTSSSHRLILQRILSCQGIIPQLAADMGPAGGQVVAFPIREKIQSLVEGRQEAG